MALIPAFGRITITRGALGEIEYQVTATASSFPAGSAVTLTIQGFSRGLNPPAVPDSFNIRLRDGNGTLVTTYGASGFGTEQVTIHLRSNGQASGAARSGTLYVDLNAVKTTGGPTETYDVDAGRESLGGSNTGSSFTFGTDRCLIRGSTTATVNIRRGSDSATLPLYAYPDTLQAVLTLAHVPFPGFNSFNIGLQRPADGASLVGQVILGSGSATGSVTFATVQPPTFTAGQVTYPVIISNNNTNEAGEARVPITSTSTTSVVVVDPRLFRTPLFQLDDNTFGTPPLSKHKATQQRLTSEQGFLGSRTTNARGEGRNGVVYNVSLVPRKPGTAVSQTGLTTTTQGGQEGWAPSLLAWSSSLPGGVWDKVVTITSPGGFTGAYVVQQGSTEYRLVSPDPNIRVRTNVQHVPGEGGRHFVAGMSIAPSGYLIDSSTGIKVPGAEVTRPRVALVRVSPTGNADGTGATFEYLAADGTWTPWLPGTPQHTFPLAASPADPDVFERPFTTNASWGVRDFRAVVLIEYEGVTYSESLVVVNVGEFTPHDEPGSASALTYGGALE